MVEFYIHSLCMVHVTLQLGIESEEDKGLCLCRTLVHGLQVYLANLATTSQIPMSLEHLSKSRYIDLDCRIIL